MSEVMAELKGAREAVRAATLADEAELAPRLANAAGLDEVTRRAIAQRAAELVTKVRTSSAPGLMETFLAEYGLSTEEGIALMCLAEALLRVPDAHTIDALIEDKIAPSDWGKHLGKSTSSLVNASTWALLVTGHVLDEKSRGIVGTLRGAVRRLGEPVIRTAVSEAMRRLGRQFVLGETIDGALKRAAGMEAKGYTYSYDMLGEAARTFPDALRYRTAYENAIRAIATRAIHGDVARNPGISIKLSALHPRYEETHHEDCLATLVPIVTELAKQAASAGMGLNIDAEEQDRLDLSLDVIEAVASDPALAGWTGFGVVVQGYGRRALPVIAWLDALAKSIDRRIMVRLVKGAYWDTEIKRAQVTGRRDLPGLHPQGRDRRLVPCLRPLAAVAGRADLPAVRDAQRAHRGERPCHVERRGVRVPAPPRHGRDALRGDAPRAAGPLPDLCPGGRARGPARLPRPPPSGERRQLLVRQPDRRRAHPGRGGGARPVQAARRRSDRQQAPAPAA